MCKITKIDLAFFYSFSACICAFLGCCGVSFFVDYLFGYHVMYLGFMSGLAAMALCGFHAVYNWGNFMEEFVKGVTPPLPPVIEDIPNNYIEKRKEMLKKKAAQNIFNNSYKG